jgi:DUF4097 and DUF4098 domain-containing protein YvlB
VLFSQRKFLLGHKSKFIWFCVGLFLFASPAVLAQKNFSKTYSVSKNVKLELANRSGSITVQGWQRNEIKITADLESPTAKIVPQIVNNNIVINVVRDNSGRSDVGDVNFNIRVPYGATVDIETMKGNLTVRDVSGSSVRAHISTEGDITLTNIKSANVTAENITGDIFFDGELAERGNYRLSLSRGNINIRIPFDSSFKLVATAPSSRNIAIGPFSNAGLNIVSDGRRVYGNVNGGSATFNVVNQRGSISFIRR